ARDLSELARVSRAARLQSRAAAFDRVVRRLRGARVDARDAALRRDARLESPPATLSNEPFSRRGRLYPLSSSVGAGRVELRNRLFPACRPTDVRFFDASRALIQHEQF